MLYLVCPSSNPWNEGSSRPATQKNPMKHILMAVLLSSALVIPPAAAQNPYQGYGGCVDFRSVPVWTEPVYQLNDAAFATVAANGAPVILVNPASLQRFSPLMQRWIYYHECGHHALGHAVRGIPLTQEQEADCFAVVRMVQAGELPRQMVPQVQHELASAGPGDRTHLPGPNRAINLIACLQSAGI